MEQRIAILAQVPIKNRSEFTKENVFQLLAKVDLDDFRTQTQFELSHPNWI